MWLALAVASPANSAASPLLIEGNYEYFKVLDNNLADAMNSIEASWNKITDEIGQERQIQVWRKGVESGIYLDEF
jgi:hypothetical protein